MLLIPNPAAAVTAIKEDNDPQQWHHVPKMDFHQPSTPNVGIPNIISHKLLLVIPISAGSFYPPQLQHCLLMGLCLVAGVIAITGLRHQAAAVCPQNHNPAPFTQQIASVLLIPNPAVAVTAIKEDKDPQQWDHVLKMHFHQPSIPNII